MTHARHKNLISWALLGLATISGLLLRMSFVTKSSIWHDEGFSVMLALRSPAQIWVGAARDVHPPLYYELLHYFIGFFGNTEVALRSLSVIAGVLLIPLAFLITKRIATTRAAVIAAWLVAFSPFLVRYSQEARMYGVVSVFLALALLCVVYIADKPHKTWPYIVYTLAITAGLYTHYFTILVVMAFWLYLVSLYLPQRKSHFQASKILLSMRWWLANIVALILFIPWLPNLIAQLKRGQGLSWLPKTNSYSLHDAMWQFLNFTDGHKLPNLLYWVGPLIVIGAAIYISQTNKERHNYPRLLEFYTFVPIGIALGISLFKPVFHERYFSFAVIGICIILALVLDKITQKYLWFGVILTLLLVSGELASIYNVYQRSDHQVRTTISELNTRYQPGDILLAGEYATYFDGSYYNRTGKTLQLYTGDYLPNGYGESGLLYDQQVYLGSYSDIPNGARVWLIGKVGEQAYYHQVPGNWKLVEQRSAGYSEVRLYQVQ